MKLVLIIILSIGVAIVSFIVGIIVYRHTTHASGSHDPRPRKIPDPQNS